MGGVCGVCRVACGMVLDCRAMFCHTRSIAFELVWYAAGRVTRHFHPPVLTGWLAAGGGGAAEAPSPTSLAPPQTETMYISAPSTPSHSTVRATLLDPLHRA